jgi:uncharacterized protein (TIGR03435 family)
MEREPAIARLGILVALFLPSQGLAQAENVSEPPAFEAASIKLNKSGDQASGMFAPGGGRFTATNCPLRSIITGVYHLQDYQLLDLPAWANTERYDIVAKAEANLRGSAIFPMVQTLLEERFHLRSHRETRQLPVYILVVSKPDRLAESKSECAPLPSGAPPPPPQPGKMACGNIFMFPEGASRIRISGTKAPIDSLIDLLSRLTGRPVLNKTGLTGNYDIEVAFAADPNSPAAGQAPPPEDALGPSLFTALYDNLGLKLESQKGPVAVLVVDTIDRPSKN